MTECNGCKLEFNVVTTDTGCSISTATNPPEDPDGHCIEGEEGEPCEEEYACKPESQTLSITVAGNDRHKWVLTPNQAGSPAPRIGNFNNSATVDVGAEFPNGVDAVCGQQAMNVNVINKVTMNTVIDANFRCTACDEE